VSIRAIYPANFIEIIGIVPQIQRFKLFYWRTLYTIVKKIGGGVAQGPPDPGPWFAGAVVTPLNVLTYLLAVLIRTSATIQAKRVRDKKS